MEFDVLDEAAALVEKANSDLEPELLTAPVARAALARYARIRRLVDYGVAALSRKLDDPSALARATGTSVGKAKETSSTGRVLRESDELGSALQHGEVSLEQAAEIARAEESAPGVAKELISVAKRESFQILKDAARKAKLEAEQHHDLAGRQHRARTGRNYTDSLGMVNVHLRFEPHVGTPIVNRAEAEARRCARAAHAEGRKEPFEAHLADAYARMLVGKGKASTTRPELVVVVSHQVANRGWKDVRQGEMCKIPGIGPIAPRVAKDIAQDAFLNGVLYDGHDLRHFKRWGRHIPKEIRVALELGDPPDFDGVKCSGCGTRIGNQFDHIEPRAARGPTAKFNLDPKCCWNCHPKKTERDRKAGKLKPRPDPERGPPRGRARRRRQTRRFGQL